MKRISTATLVSLVFRPAAPVAILGAVAVVAATSAGHAAIIPVDQPMAGKSQAEWNALHWKWLAEIPWDGNHPIQDRNGSHILRGQSGPVWFLPPANTTQPVTRMISVPHDQILHVFLVGAECSNVEDPPSYGGNEEEMRACAQRYENESSCDVDGVPVTDTAGYITTSPLFNFVLPPVNSFGVSGGGAGQGVAHGANVMIQFSAGSHMVRVRSRYPDVGWSNDVTHVITVYERPTLAVRPLPGTERPRVVLATPKRFHAAASKHC